MQFALNQWSGVGFKLLIWQPAVFGDPVARDEMFQIGDVIQRLQTSRPAVGFIAFADELNHVAALALHRSLHCGCATGEGLVHIRLAGVMCRGALGVAELHRAGLETQCRLHNLCQAIGGTGQHGVTKGIELGFVRADFVALGVLQAFTHHHDTTAAGIHHFLHAGEKLGFIKGDLR